VAGNDPGGSDALTAEVATGNRDDFAGPSPADLASQNAKLKRELDRMRMERDVLKKAIGIFAEVPK
jgi:transposase